MRTLTNLLLTLLFTLPAWAASSSINGEVFVAAGTSGTNALPSSRTTNVTVLVQSNAGDGTNAFRVNAATTHTTGNLVEVQNNGTNSMQVANEGGIRSGYRAGEFSDFSSQSNPGLHALGVAELYGTANATVDVTLQAYRTLEDLTNDVRYASWDILSGINFSEVPFVFLNGYVKNEDSVVSEFYLDVRTNSVEMYLGYAGNIVTHFNPTASDGSTAYTFDTPIAHTSGNLVEFEDNNVDQVTIDHSGKVTALAGFSSTATDAAVTIAATGWTNTFAKNAVVYMDGTGLTFTVYNNALTPIYTNSVTLTGATVLLQPSGKVIITAGTLGVGRATPF